MTVTLHAQQPVVVAASNQSTGYCPEPASWTAVAAALDSLGVVDPGGFTDEFEFRRCPSSRAPNLVKDDWYVCALDATPRYPVSGTSPARIGSDDPGVPH
jgi:hypothetical protein